MKTNKMVWMDSYLTKVDTVVTAVQNGQVRVEDTVFFAFSAGQESDTGTLGEYPVLLAEKVGFDIVYTLPPTHTLKPGDPVRISIGWERRYSLIEAVSDAHVAVMTAGACQTQG